MWRISRHTAARLKRMVLFAFKRALAKALRLRFLFETSSQRPKLFSRAPLQSTEVFALLSLHMWRFRTQGRNAPKPSGDLPESVECRIHLQCSCERHAALGSNHVAVQTEIILVNPSTTFVHEQPQ